MPCPVRQTDFVATNISHHEGPYIEASSECSWLYEESCCLGKSDFTPSITQHLSPPQSLER